MSSRTARILLFAALGIAVLTLGLYFYRFRWGLSQDPEQWDHFGSYVGGTLGPLFAALAFAAALYAIREQGQQSSLDELQRLMLSTSEKIDALLAQRPDKIPTLAAEQLRADGALESISAMLEKLHRQAIWATDENIAAINGLVATLSISATRRQLTAIELQLVHLVRLLKAHESLGGAAIIREHYPLLYTEIVDALWIFDSLNSDAVAAYFEPEKTVAESRRVAAEERQRQEALFAEQDAAEQAGRSGLRK